MNFSRLGPFEVCLLGAIGFALFKGLTVTPLRIALLLGLLHLALMYARSAETLALIAPLALMQPLRQRFGDRPLAAARPSAKACAATFAIAMFAAFLVSRAATFAPPATIAPDDAIAALKQYGAARVLNDYDFGGAMIAEGIRPFIDGRDVYGVDFMLAHDRALSLRSVNAFTAMLADYRVDATLLRPSTPAVEMLDRLPGWRRVHSDAIAVAHARVTGP